MCGTKRYSGPRVHIDKPYEDDNILVHFIGDVTCTRYSELKSHTNPGYEICFIPYGRGIFKIEDQVYPIDSGQIFMTKQPQVHAGLPAQDDPYRILYICFAVKSAKEGSLWHQLENELTNVEFPVAYDHFDMETVHSFLMAELLEKELYSCEMVGNLIHQFILLTVRNFKSKAYNDEARRYCENPNELSNRVIRYINNHLHDYISLEKISEAINYSVSYISRCFKDQTGFTVMEYYNFARLEQAKKYLVETDYMVSEIADKLGFSSIHHFSNSFKGLYGISPSQFRIRGRADTVSEPGVQNFANNR